MDFFFSLFYNAITKFPFHLVTPNSTFHTIVLFQSWSALLAEAANAMDMHSVDDLPSARFTWTIENFRRLNTKELYSEIFLVGGCKW